MNKQIPEIEYVKVAKPLLSEGLVPVDLTAETMHGRKEQVVQAMAARGLDLLLVYGDREHGGNFAYLTGFEPRFEEAVLAVKADGSAVLMLGNENLKMSNYSAICAAAVHVPHFSLPNQPMETALTMTGLMESAGVRPGMNVGIAGWKMFTSALEDNQELFDVPAFIVDAVKAVVGTAGLVVSSGDIFLHPQYGLRTRVNANEIAHYEFGAALASDCVLQAMDQIKPGKTELEIAGQMCAMGQPISVTTICATGDRFTNGVVFPRNKEIRKGDKFSLTMGLRGGLSSRSAYVAETLEDLEEGIRDYQEVLAKPYYRAAVVWYETVGIGVKGGDLYQTIEMVLPKEQYHWSLNPGHFTSDEEWLSSPMWPQSEIRLASGMMLQMDIIPGIAGYGGAGAEDGIVIADEALREQIKAEYSAVWERFMRRRQYLTEVLGIQIKPELLPMSDLTGYMRPFLLNQEYAFKVR